MSCCAWGSCCFPKQRKPQTGMCLDLWQVLFCFFPFFVSSLPLFLLTFPWRNNNVRGLFCNYYSSVYTLERSSWYRECWEGVRLGSSLVSHGVHATLLTASPATGGISPWGAVGLGVFLPKFPRALTCFYFVLWVGIIGRMGSFHTCSFQSTVDSNLV